MVCLFCYHITINRSSVNLLSLYIFYNYLEHCPICFNTVIGVSHYTVVLAEINVVTTVFLEMGHFDLVLELRKA